MLTISVQDVLSFRELLVETNPAPKTINRRVTSISGLYKYLAGASAEMRLQITDREGKRCSLDVRAELTYAAAHLYLTKAKEGVVPGEQLDSNGVRLDAERRAAGVVTSASAPASGMGECPQKS